MEGEDTDTVIRGIAAMSDHAFHPITNDTVRSYRSMTGDAAASDSRQQTAGTDQPSD